MFPISISCFQSTNFVFNLNSLFPNYFCFQSYDLVSNLKILFPIYFYVFNLQCFQCMFPIYILPKSSNLLGILIVIGLSWIGVRYPYTVKLHLFTQQSGIYSQLNTVYAHSSADKYCYLNGLSKDRVTIKRSHQ